VDPLSVSEELDHVKKQLESKDLCAVGEIGVDLYWDSSTKDLQQEAFAQQIRWAKEYDLPIAIHCRDAFKEVFEVLEAEKSDKLRGVFHCFTGTIEDAHKAIGYNLKLGIGGVVTFKNGKIDQFLNEIDLEHIVLETDAPYLAPKPFRGKRNESAYLLHIAEKLSEIYQVPLAKIEETTTNNAKKLFKLD
ncbi:MAG TPA: hydrolase TatD, partial [Leeuwenhoekiella sp.]|nr:hydrolase TatD [Leeuwenhoekiella sp.]